MQVKGNIINIFDKTIKYGSIEVQNGNINKIEILAENIDDNAPYILPGFVDAHVHVESSMLTPVQFARLAVVHGTVSTVSDPHEIGNVLGKAGVEYMIHNARQTPFKFCFGAPSCVPATVFETAGATITPTDIEELFQQYEEIGYLAEVMNFPGVLNGDADMLAKIALAKAYHKPVDGHAPGLRGEAAKKYIEAGCQTDHECFTADEALDKLKYGMKILIREGSAAKNFDALIELLPEYYNELMFCSDDKHPDNLVEGHINLLVLRALQKFPTLLFEILQVACVNPVKHYNLPVGLLQEGDNADFVVVENLESFKVLATYISGEIVAENGFSKIPDLPSNIVNHFDCNFKTIEQFQVKAKTETIKVIEVLDGQLITLKSEYPAMVKDDMVVSDLINDILKITVVNRYHDAPPAIGFIKNFGLKQGAIGSSVAHDSHNIIVVGVDDESIVTVVNMLIEAQGGVAAISENKTKMLLKLPIAGIMTGEDGYLVAKEYSAIDKFAKDLGCTLNSPFMSLSFMALLVIPNIKLSDIGLFDGENFSLTSLFIEKIN
ncbi:MULTISPECIES: adenine deaminase [unclassified Arcicella]|uniref:adenine deaminase n=1 Tax=unclassified Arcicella TaxID=2644986 RepID=UPI0028670D21|nr:MULTISPECIES: adenine deaminase [unclassified Arcicella]MDR6560851.1 adenine deaminase [Arcicella sp. BE51]MDR6810735.1 adenine deaminase [Arcicella sp. BE140]MDR6822085.1 adenine deaminase [Arcicella sp. BE139]